MLASRSEVILRVSESLLLEVLDGECPRVVVLLAVVLPACQILVLSVFGRESDGGRGLLGGLVHGGEKEVRRLELVPTHALRQEGLRVVLAGEHVQLGLGQLEGAVLKHAYLVKGVAALVGQGVRVPDTVLFDLEKVEDLLEAALQKIHCASVLQVLFLHFFGLLLGSVNVIHDFFELNSA